MNEGELGLLFALGMYAVSLYYMIVKRNLVRLLFALEVMMNAANLIIVSSSIDPQTGTIGPLAHSIALVTIAVEACLLAVGLSIVYRSFLRLGTLDVRKMSRLRR
jgi:NADH:ubiquinone oxidoreductase subunit K